MTNVRMLPKEWIHVTSVVNLWASKLWTRNGLTACDDVIRFCVHYFLKCQTWGPSKSLIMPTKTYIKNSLHDFIIFFPIFLFSEKNYYFLIKLFLFLIFILYTKCTNYLFSLYVKNRKKQENNKNKYCIDLNLFSKQNECSSF